MMKMTKKLGLIVVLCGLMQPPALLADKGDMPLEPRVVNVSQTVIQMPLNKGVSIEDAVQAMVTSAENLNMKLVSHLKISDELKQRDIETRHFEVLQLCNPEDAGKLVQMESLYAAFIPCRIAVVEEEDGQVWLMMQNLDILINHQLIPPKLAQIAIKINQQMLSVMAAGVSGEF